MKTSWLLPSLEIYFIQSVYWCNYIYSMTNNDLKDLFLLFQTLFVVWSFTFKGWIIDGWWIQLKINNNKIKSMDAGEFDKFTVSEFTLFIHLKYVNTLYCLLRYFSHGSGLPLRFHVTSGLWVAKRQIIPLHNVAPAPMTTTSGINWNYMR